MLSTYLGALFLLMSLAGSLNAALGVSHSSLGWLGVSQSSPGLSGVWQVSRPCARIGAAPCKIHSLRRWRSLHARVCLLPVPYPPGAYTVQVLEFVLEPPVRVPWHDDT